jgi:PilZ domain
MDDRRNVKRTRVLRSAKIIVPRRSPVIHCTVQNITSGGACLKLANTSGVPDTFELTFEHGRTRRACRVAWRTGDMLGVAFVGEERCAEAQSGEASPPLIPAEAGGDSADAAKDPVASPRAADSKADRPS